MRTSACLLTAILTASACQSAPPQPEPIPVKKVKATETPARSAAGPSERAVVRLRLAGPVAQSKAEISGMAWFGDLLVLLPQYPAGAVAAGNVYTLTRAEVLAAIDDPNGAALNPGPMAFTGPGKDDIEGFEGYEAIAIEGKTAWLLIETDDAMAGVLVSGTFAEDGGGLTVATKPSAVLKSQNPALGNMSYEALLRDGLGLTAFYEANGRKVNGRARIKRFDKDLTPLPDLPMTSIELRITDATAPDAEGRFWAINYQYRGDKALATQVDPIADKHGRGPTHTARPQTVERLIELRSSPEGGVTKTDRPPIQFQLIDQDRNWEGIVRLGDRGFLIITDEHPRSEGTILAFVPTP